MCIDEELMKEGYELTEGRNEDELAIQLWVNEKMKRGIRIEWFPLKKVRK